MKMRLLTLFLGGALWAVGPLSVARGKERDLESQLAAATAVWDRESMAEIYRRIHAEKPSDVVTLKGLIGAELRIGQTEAARVLVAELAAVVSAEDAKLLEYQGDMHRRDEAWAAAVRSWQAALQQAPDSADLLSKLAQHYLHQEKNPAMAAVYFKRLLPMSDSSRNHIEVAKVAIAMRDWNTVVERTATLKTEFSTNRETKSYLPKFERVIEAMVRITELDAREKAEADPVPTILKRGRLFLDSGFPELALQDARRALVLQPHALHVRLHYATAAVRLWEDMERVKGWGIETYRYRRSAPPMAFLESLTELDAALFENPEAVEALRDRTELLFHYDQYKLAGRDAELLLRLDADSVTALRVLALIAEKEGYFGRATQFIDRAEGLAPDDPKLLDAASLIHARQGDYDQVIALCDRWLALPSQNADHKKARERRQAARESLQQNAR